ncbi:hypothetical protein SK128_016218 [Halocaridina rubra]|uniref:Uncharacterized protein n=1 Tax=Halocaridina rubra TaxID=373956 RepID=A0AAN8W9N8_HALRR
MLRRAIYHNLWRIDKMKEATTLGIKVKVKSPDTVGEKKSQASRRGEDSSVYNTRLMTLYES